jgi:hypothetical protein
MRPFGTFVFVGMGDYIQYPTPPVRQDFYKSQKHFPERGKKKLIIFIIFIIFIILLPLPCRTLAITLPLWETLYPTNHIPTKLNPCHLLVDIPLKLILNWY